MNLPFSSLRFPLLKGFQSDAGPWSVLAADALVEEEGAYKPDFSAHVGSEQLRCIRISKASFDTMASLPKHAPPMSLTVETGGMDSYRSIGSSNGARSDTTTPMGRTVSKGRGQGRFSPARARAATGDSGKSTSASLKIRQALSVTAMSPSAAKGAASREKSGEKSGNEVWNARVMEEEKKDVVREEAEVVGVLGGEHAVVPSEEAVPNCDYTTSDTTEPDSGHNM